MALHLLKMRSFGRARSLCLRPSAQVPSCPIRKTHGVPRFPGDQMHAKTQDGPLDYSSRNFSYMMVAGTGMAGGVMAKNMVGNFVSHLAPARDTLAVANIEVDLKQIPEGQSLTVSWRGKPLFIRHREQWEIDAAKNVSMSELVDPQTDAERVKPGKENFLVLIGICTHLGCVPLGQSGHYGGWYCPCHGSHYDTSGRIRQGPAPKNLAIPPYTFLPDEDDVIYVAD